MLPVTVESSSVTVKSSDVEDSGLDVGDSVSTVIHTDYIYIYHEKAL